VRSVCYSVNNGGSENSINANTDSVIDRQRNKGTHEEIRLLFKDRFSSRGRNHRVAKRP